MKKLLLGLLLASVGFAAQAQEESVPTFRTWAPTAPMGWNSWDCYYSTVNEKIVLRNANYMAEHLRDYGWQYVVVDIRWYANHPSLGGGWYNQTKTPECQLDEYGRYVPSPTRFPSAMVNGRNEGFKALADSIHKLGLKFGIHIMRGLPKYILDDPGQYKLKGAEDTSWGNVYKAKTPECAWLQDNLTVRNNRYGQLYYNSIIDLYASWGVDFIKVDDLSRPYYESEIEMLRKAIDQCGRPIVLSLSPGKTDYGKVSHLHENANQWRMIDDLWDRWDDIKSIFKEAPYWANHHVQGCYADADILPLGRISMTVSDPDYCNYDGGRKTKLTHDEQRTLMSLWGICHSPLFFGGELTRNDDFTNSLLTNREYLRMHHYGQNAHEVSNADGKIVWTSEVPDSLSSNGGKDRWLAMFYTDAGNGWIFDQKALYASETVAYTTDGHKVDVDITLPDTTKVLALVVDDAGDGFSYDHGDWINPTFISRNGYEVPVTGDFIKEKYTNSFYNTINEDTNVYCNGKMAVLGATYDRGFSMDANAMILFNVPDSIVGFRAMGAADDSGIGQDGSTTSMKFYVFNCDPRVSAGGQAPTADVTCDLTQFGYDADDDLTLTDVWTGENVGTMKPGMLTQTVKSHAVRLLRVSSSRKETTGVGSVNFKSPRAGNKVFTVDGRYAGTSFDGLSRGIYVVKGMKVVR